MIKLNIKYRQDMTPEELEKLMAELRALEAAYEDYFKRCEEGEDEHALLHKAALNRGQP